MWRDLFATLRIEDWLLAGWVGLASPLLGASGTEGAGPFDPGHPVVGVLRLVAVVGALACLITRTSDPGPDSEGGVIERGAMGPLVGGLILVGVSAVTGLALTEAGAWAVVIGAVVLLAGLRLRWPALPTSVRRALVTPFILAAGGIYWSVLDGVTNGDSLVGLAAGSDLRAVAPLAGFLLLFSAVYYAMLVFAPRQVAEREGSPISWLARFAVFAVSLVFGLAWLRPFGV
jgi:hypothetical protein